jgi:uncharacterized membrane protein
MKIPTDARARPALPWVALSLSTLLNLFLLGVIAGHFLGRGHPPEISITPMASTLARAEAAMDPADAAAFSAALKRDRSQYLRSMAQVAAARRELARQIAAQPFDPHAASLAFDAWRTSWDRFIGDFSGPLIDALGAISPDGRRRLMNARRERRERRQGAADRGSP